MTDASERFGTPVRLFVHEAREMMTVPDDRSFQQRRRCGRVCPSKGEDAGGVANLVNGEATCGMSDLIETGRADFCRRPFVGRGHS